MKWLLGMLGMMGLLHAKAPAYDPMKTAAKTVRTELLEHRDEKRQRTIPLRVYLPSGESAAPVILFSHGLGGSRDNNPYLGEHWAKRGYVVVFVQHPGSDESVWKDARMLERMSQMKKAASLENLALRCADVPAVLDALTVWNKQRGHVLHGRMNLEKIGMSGHSFGAVTTQALVGQNYRSLGPLYQEPRLDAALMFSPSPPQWGDPAAAFSAIKVPCLLMTGTLDTSPIGGTSAEDRLKVFPHLSLAPAWQVVFDGATHGSFGQREISGKKIGQEIVGSRYHPAILALSTAFWDAQLRDDKNARAWLDGDAARKVLLPADQWEKRKP
jgi:predicted dienelactone hydrolase